MGGLYAQNKTESGAVGNVKSEHRIPTSEYRLSNTDGGMGEGSTLRERMDRTRLRQSVVVGVGGGVGVGGVIQWRRGGERGVGSGDGVDGGTHTSPAGRVWGERSVRRQRRALGTV
jgi:hypothetical protein